MKRIVALILALVMTMALVSCGGDKPTSSTPSNPTTSNPTTSNPATSTPGTDKPAEPTLTKAEQLKKDNAEKYGGNMISLLTGVCPTMDMHSPNSSSVQCSRWALHVWEHVVVVDANGKIYPRICDYEVSPDGCTYTLTLRDRHFSTGEKIEMEDIEASLRRYVAMNYTTQSGFDKRWKGTTWKIEGDTLTFQLETFSINFDSILKDATGGFVIMPKEICEKYAPDWSTGTYDAATDLTWGCTTTKEITEVEDVIGSGPYKLKSYMGDAEIVLERNENYEMIIDGCEDAIGLAAPAMAYFDTITFKPNPDTASQTAATLAGEYHNGAVQTDMWDTALSMGIKRWDAGNTWTHGIFFNLHETNADSPIADVNVRKAIRAAIDPNAALLAILGTEERITMEPEPYPVLKSNAYYSSNLWEEQGDYKQDLEKAKEYLAQSSYNGEPIVYLFHASGSFYKGAMYIIPVLESIGLNMEALIVDNGSHTAMRKDYKTGHDIGCWEVQKNAENPVLHTTFVNGTVGWWSSPARDAAIATMLSTPTGSAESVAAYNDYLQAVVDECPYYLFGQAISFLWTSSDYVKGMNGQTHYFWNSYFAK